MGFPGVLGHPRAQALMARALERGRVPPALLFVGPSGVGKRTVALAVARALLCETGKPFPCDRCSSCSRCLKGMHPDLFLVEALTKVIKIDQVRDVVREIGSSPFEGRARAFVIDDAHELTEQAANALLKSLEEPAPRSHVILVTSAPQALLPTVRSRCQLVRFGPLPSALVEQHLRSVAGLDAEEAALRAAAAAGSLGVALSLESQVYRDVRDRLVGLLESAASSGPLQRMEMAQVLADQEDLDAGPGRVARAAPGRGRAPCRCCPPRQSRSRRAARAAWPEDGSARTPRRSPRAPRRRGWPSKGTPTSSSPWTSCSRRSRAEGPRAGFALLAASAPC